VHVDCGVGSGHDPMTDVQMLAEMKARGLAVVSLPADMGNGEVRFAEKDLPRVNGTAGPGDGIRLGSGGIVQVDVGWSATRELSGTIELVSNGKVVAAQKGTAGPGSPLVPTTSRSFRRSGWLCAKRMDARGH